MPFKAEDRIEPLLEVVINALQVGNRSGTGYYCQKLIKHLPSIGTDFRFCIVLPDSFRASPICRIIEPLPNVRLLFVNANGQLRRIAFEQIILPRLAKKLGAALLHSLAFVAPLRLTTRSVVTVHDLAYRLFPETLTRFRRLYLEMGTKHAMRKASRIITVSEAVKTDIVHEAGIPHGDVVVTHEGGFEARGLSPRVEDQYINRLLSWEGEYILFIGTMEPRKNLPRLLSAFALFKQQYNGRCKLVIVGRKGWLTEATAQRLSRLGIAGDVLMTGFLPSDVVFSLMRKASLFVMPSLYEGFGLPLVTAMGCGTAVAASRAGSIPEILGESGLLFDPLNVEDMAESLLTLMSEPSLRKRLVEMGIRRAEHFTWERCASKTVAIYRDLLCA